MKIISTFRTFLLPPVLAFVCLPAFGESGDLDLDSLLKSTAIEPPHAVAFREERHNPMLREPLILSGTLEYLEEGVLRKNIKTPIQESYLVEPGQVSVEKDGKVNVVRGRRGKLLTGFLGGIEAVLAGDIDSLEENFEIRLEGVRDAWQLELIPTSKKLARHMERLLVEGGATKVNRISIYLDEEFHVINLMHEPETGTQ